jgi:hypothetical protein
MALWLNRSLVQAPRNGTTTHTISFTPATAGNLLVLVMEGAVTHTVPTGWTRQAQGLNNTELSVYTKTATAGESSFSTTHNGSNYPIGVLVYEFPSGSTWSGGAGSGSSALGLSAASPTLTGLTGTNLAFSAVAIAVADSFLPSVAWSSTSGTVVEDTDVALAGSPTDGYGLSVAYLEDFTGTSFTATGTISKGGVVVNGKEALTFAVKVAASAPALSGAGAAQTLSLTAGAGTGTSTFTLAYAGATAAPTLASGDTATASDLTAGAGITLATPYTGGTAYDPNKVWSVTYPTPTTTLAASITANAYFSVTLNRTAGAALKALRIKAAAGGASTPRGFSVRSSVDGYATDLLTVASIPTVRPTLTAYSADISALGTQTAVTFRIYSFTPTGGASIEFDDLQIDYAPGTVASLSGTGAAQTLAVTNAAGSGLAGRSGAASAQTLAVANAAGSGTSALQSISSLVDDFTTLNTTTRWTASDSSAFAASGGSLVMSATAAYPTLSSQSRYSLVGSSVYVDLPESGRPQGVDAHSAEFQLQLWAANGDYLTFLVGADPNPYTLTRKTIGGATTQLSDASVPDATRYFRISESGGTVTWAYSADLVTWTTHVAVAAPIDVSSVRVVLSAGHWDGADPTPTYSVNGINTAALSGGTGAGAALTLTLTAASGAGASATSAASGVGAPLLLTLSPAPSAGRQGAFGVGEAQTLTLVGRAADGARLALAFRPPTQDVWFRLAGRGLFGSYQQGLTVYRRDGVWATAFSPTADQLAGADRIYAGGHLHYLTTAQRDELVAAGFATNVSLMEVR